MVLETNRLILRELNETDFDAVHSYASNLDNVKYMTFGPNDEEATRTFITTCIEKSKANPRMKYDFAITLRGSGRLIGACGIYLGDAEEGMLGWILHKDFWKQGFGTELAAELIGFGFENLNLHRIYATCFAENYGSYRVMERNHMRREAHFVKNRKARDGWVDELHYAILEDEWKNHTTK